MWQQHGTAWQELLMLTAQPSIECSSFAFKESIVTLLTLPVYISRYDDAGIDSVAVSLDT